MEAEMTEIVMPGDTNHLGTCFGGTIMSWIDKVAAVAAQRLVGSVVTASVDRIEFKKPIRLGDVVTLKSSVNKVWGTSMEVGVKVLVQSPKPVLDGTRAYNKLDTPVHACSAYLTFVAINDIGQRRRPESLELTSLIIRADGDLEWARRYAEAHERREHRLERKDNK